MNKKIKRVAIIVIIAFVLILFLLFLILPINTTKKFDINEYKYDAALSIELDNVPIYAQQTGYTCYAVSMVITKNFLGMETNEEEFIAELGLQDRSQGMIPREYLPFAEEALATLPYSITLHNPKSETEILNMITSSLIDGIPVIFFYSAVDDWNKPSYNTHYGVIYGIDMENKIVKSSNPYGYLDELSFVDFFKGLSFESYEAEPAIHRIGRITGYIKNNNIFLLEYTD